MKVKIYKKENKELYKELNAVRIASRPCPLANDETEMVVYSGGHGYAFNMRFYDVVIEA